MIETPKVLQTAVQSAAVIHITVPRNEMQKVMGPGLQELMGTLADQRITPLGPWFAHHLKMTPETFDFELGVPIDKPVAPRGRVKAGQLPATTVARTIYQGPYEGLHTAWMEFEKWIAANGHESGPSLWETYLTNPATTSDPTAWRTELTRPLLK